MKNVIANVKASAYELRKTRSIVLMALLAALSIIIGSYSIMVTPYLKVGLSTIVNQMAYSIIGPVSGPVYAFVLNTVSAIVSPKGPFNFIYAISPVISGFLYGLFYYKKDITIARAFIANFVVALICNVILNTLVLSYMQGSVFMTILPIRALKNLIQWPVNSILIYALARLLNKTGRIK